MKKYSDVFVDWLARLGYTHCFFVAGGNIMHLLDGVRTRMTCVPVVHEVAAGIAVEYFNESEGDGRAFALVTAGPGLTNIVTALAGAYIESRELLVVGGQVKTTDLARGEVRQRGIQEVDGVAIATPVTVHAERFELPAPQSRVSAAVELGRTARKGPVFLELPLDVQGAPVDPAELSDGSTPPRRPGLDSDELDHAAATVADLVQASARPLFLIGGGVSRSAARELLPALHAAGVPLMTTPNGADRIPRDEPLFAGRPNTWGQRSANVLVQQADLLVAFGTRLGLQQTGFNWQGFAPGAKVVQVDVDANELSKGHPHVHEGLALDADELLRRLLPRVDGDHGAWRDFCSEVRALLPLDDPENQTAAGFVSPYRFYMDLSRISEPGDVLIPCSSGGAFTVSLQALEPKAGQVVITDKGLASMGYGLSGAIGAALAHPNRRTVLIEGDGGFSQNLQELATVAVNDLNLKIFIFDDNGYASIRMTQRNYFDGDYLGCDTQTGLGFPDWEQLFAAYRVPVMRLQPGYADDAAFKQAFDGRGRHAFIVPVDPEQTYFPKISSRVTATGSMESAPLHLVSPDLPDALAEQVFRYLA